MKEKGKKENEAVHLWKMETSKEKETRARK